MGVGDVEGMAVGKPVSVTTQCPDMPNGTKRLSHVNATVLESAASDSIMFSSAFSSLLATSRGLPVLKPPTFHVPRFKTRWMTDTP